MFSYLSDVNCTQQLKLLALLFAFGAVNSIENDYGTLSHKVIFVMFLCVMSKGASKQRLIFLLLLHTCTCTVMTTLETKIINFIPFPK